jgi:hypothetical protein
MQEGDEEFPYGPYHRLRSATQTEDDDWQQMLSGELWGRASSYTGGPRRAKAWRGTLGPNDHGIEFFARVAPDLGRSGVLIWWSEGRDGVRVAGEFAIIEIRVTKVER